MNASVPSVKGNTAIASLQGLKQGLANVKQSVVIPGGDPFLRLLKSGKWVYGRDNTEVEADSLWAIHPATLKHGWVCWTDYDKADKKKNEIVGEVMVPMTQPLPDQLRLPDTGRWNGQWTQQLSFIVACVSGEDVGTQVLYKTTSVGGMNAVSELIDAIMKQLDKDGANPVPVVLLEVDSYNHATWGETMVPIFDIQKWASLEDTELPDEEALQQEADKPTSEEQAEDAQQAAEKPSGRRRSKPADADNGDEGGKAADDEQPRRRRRRG